MRQRRNEEKPPDRRSGLRPGHLQDLGPHLVLPVGVAGHCEDDLAVPGQDEARRHLGARLALVAGQEGGPDPPCVGRPILFLQDAGQVGRMDDAVVELLAGIGFDEVGFRLGTPDLAAASLFVADEHHHRLAGHRLPRLGMGDAGQRRCSGHRQAGRHRGPSLDHGISLPWNHSTPPLCAAGRAEVKPHGAGFTRV